ncbi:MAG: TMEM175 family protein [Candidatus Micrarchaeia archaeon]
MGEKEISFDRGRILNLSDGIIAFSMTLMAVGIAIPDPATTPEGELYFGIVSISPKIFIFVFSFLMVGVYWIKHHSILNKVKIFDSKTIWLNMFFLLSIAFLSFTSALFGEYETDQLALGIFALNMSIAGFLLVLILIYTSKKGHIHSKYSKNMREQIILNLIVPAVFLISVIISFFNYNLAIYSWISSPVLIFLYKISKKKAKKQK